MTPTKCIVEAWVTSISCAGYDALGNPQYTVTMNYINALGTLVNVLTSITSPFGTISNLTPTVPTTTGLNSLSFTFTDYALTGQGCFGIMLMDTIGGKYCYSDFTQLPKLCCVLPTGCPRMANPNQNNTVRPNPLSSGEGRGEVCAVKVVPNPNQGKTYIYYKVGYEQNNNLQQVYEQLQIVIIESGSGKKVYQQALPSQVGMVWLNDKPLAEGHYIVILSNNNTQLCNTKMEVVK
jgi:hypothetical protein